MNPKTIVPMALLAALTSACGPKPAEATTPSPATSEAPAPAEPSPASEPTGEAAPAGPPSVALGLTDPCAASAADASVDAGRRSFPDNADVSWQVHGVTLEGTRAFSEVEPHPSTVGYPRFQLVFECRAGATPVLLGAYAFEEGAWVLLFTTSDAPGDLPRTRP